MHLDVFSEGKSLFHRMDPRSKVLCYGVFAVVVALSDGLRAPGNAFVLAVVMFFLSRVPLGEVLRRLFVVNLLLLPLWVLVPMDTPGSVPVVIGPYRATAEGFSEVLSITLRANAIVLSGIVMLGTSDLFSLVHALAHLGLPRKLVYLFFIFFRYLSLLHEEYLKLKRAMQARAFRPRTSMHTYRAYGYLIGMLVLKSYDRAENLYRAMLSRGFRGEFPLYRHFHLRGRDVVFSLVFLMATAGVVVL
ncbi:MAG: cobalt ECF transporter T component CbiQ [Nitrospirae bacterium]|nr:MAG: cobalt ECF transporter T component CbiQ [Nitrospirota bacterium]